MLLIFSFFKALPSDVCVQGCPALRAQRRGLLFNLPSPISACQRCGGGIGDPLSGGIIKALVHYFFTLSADLSN